MAGIEYAGYTLYTVQSGEFFPTSDSDNSFPPLTTSFTFASGCAEQWRIVNPDFPTEVLNSVPSSCFPGGRDVNSPGTCLPSYLLVALGEFRTPGWTSGGVRAWGADCCRNTSITAYNPVAFTTSSTNSIVETTTYIDSLDRSATDNATILSSGTMTMAAMVVYWQESDLEDFDPEYAATLADHLSIGFTPTATSEITSETATPPNRSQLPSATSNLDEAIGGSKGSGLSSGAKAGIGVGVGVGTLLVALVGALLYKRRVGRREKKLDRNSAIQNQQPEFVQRATQMQTA
ncbi:unnamed protein product [Alternaria alternata]